MVISFLSWISSSERRKEISISFNFFLFEYTYSASFLFKNLTTVLSVFPSLWQSTTRDLSRLIPISCKRCSMKFSRSFGATELGMLESLRIPSSYAVPVCDVVFQALRVCYSYSWKPLAKFSRRSVLRKHDLLALHFPFLGKQFWTLFRITFSICPCFVVTNHFVKGLYWLVMPTKMLLNSHCSFFPTVL